MAKKIAKQNHKVLTLRLNAEQSQAIAMLMTHTGKKTATGALIFAADDFVRLTNERDKLRQDLQNLETDHENLLDDIRTGQEAIASVLKAAGLSV